MNIETLDNNTIDKHAFLFFKNQQFIIQGIIADCGSYNVTTYIRTKEKTKRRKKKKINYIEFISRTNSYLSNIFIEIESSRIMFQKDYEMI